MATPTNPDTIATPEGDNEFAADQPLVPIPDESLYTPPGSTQQGETQQYKQDLPLPPDEPKPDPEAKPNGIEKFIDEVVRGEFM